MIWGAISSAGIGPLSFLKTIVTAPVYQDILEHLMLPSADQIFKDADFIFQQDLAPDLTGQQTHQTYRESMGYCQEENEKQETKKGRWSEGHCQRNLGFHTTSAVPQTDHLHAAWELRQ